MNDPWLRFAERSHRAEFSGYFERAAKDGRRGTAHWFTGPAPVRALGRSSDPAELARESERFLDSHPRGGLVGFVAFDAVGLFEPALARFPTGAPFPLAEFAFVDRFERASVGPRQPRPLRRRHPGRPVADSLPRAAYERSVRRLVTDIRNGEAFQVVLAHRRAWPRPADLLARAGALRASERYSFFYYLRFGDREIVGASPESVVEMHGRRGQINPIAGTLPARAHRGRLPLLVDPKELAEHRMLVDLARNDLGRVARAGTVRLARTERRERYARLEHLVSEVEASLRPGTGPWELLGATFPAGTVSGAPKIRATELLRREERTWRGPYAGAVACVRPGGHADFALLIRSGFAAGNRLHTAAGAGIVHRSLPGREFDETLTKLDHIERALAGDRT